VPPALIAPSLSNGWIRLRPWVAGDAPALEMACGDQDISRFTTVPRHFTIGAAEAWIKRQHERLAGGEAIVLAIEPLAAAWPVGMVGLFGLGDEDGGARFGYWVVNAHRGSGLATEAVRMLAEWAFDQLAIEALHIDLEPGNVGSRRVALAVGARHERQLRRHLDGEDVLLERFTLLRRHPPSVASERAPDALAASNYDAMAEAYDAAIVEGDRPYNSLYERPAIISMLPSVTGKRVLDVGCGSGPLSAWLASHGAAEVVGFDASARMVGLAQQKRIERVSFRVADLTQPLDFLTDRSFDLAVASLVMHYLRDWVQPLRELRRVLKPDGEMILSTHHPASDIKLSATGNYFDTELVHERWNLDGEAFEVHFWRRPLTAIFSAFDQAGFSVRTFLEPQPLPECRTKFPQAWEALTTKPAFAFFKLRPTG
jgi:RimJ/RimL family protein N-acetyltransferase/SAM-dependent methyltransferase